MVLLEQAIQLLSEAPGNVIYHLMTLFALQAVLAISLSQWRRDRTDKLAWRMVWGSATIFVARLALLAVELFVQGDAFTAISILPPLEQAVHTGTAVLIVWTFIPHSERFPRFGHALLILALCGIGVMTVSFLQTWRDLAAAGEAYNGSAQATVWGIIQLILLGLGLVFIIARSSQKSSLPAIIVGLLLLAHVAHFGNYPEIITTNTNIPYAIRFGQLIIFPLWAAFAYRYSFHQVLSTHRSQEMAAADTVRTLNLASTVIDLLKTDSAIPPAIQMAVNLTDADFVGLALISEWDGGQLYLTSNLSMSDENKLRDWYLNLIDWPAFRQALDQQQTVQLATEGVGARQLHDWYKEIGLEPLGAMLIQPLIAEGRPLGLLLLAGPSGREEWAESEKELVSSLATYLAQAIDSGRLLAQGAQIGISRSIDGTEMETIVSGRIIALEEERNQLQAELTTTMSRLEQAETNAAMATKQARDLAETLDEIERTSRDDRIEALESEIEALRESLIEAEEAMAFAAASEGELSPEWVMHTITRYSGQLEEAQARIQMLEDELVHWEHGPLNEVVAALIQELRTPMTSITGYTDLLLAERVGVLGDKQRDSIQRVQANIARMDTLLDQLMQLTMVVSPSASLPVDVFTNVEDVLETAVSTVLTQVREKNLRMELDIVQDLPPLPVNPKALRQILNSLLGNACQSSPNDSRIKVVVRREYLSTGAQASNNGHEEKFPFIHLSVTDSGGGIRVEDRARVFDPHHDADSPLISGLGDTGAALSVARALAEANSGRLWVDSLMGVGTTFSALFPLSPEPVVNDKETAVSINGEGAA